MTLLSQMSDICHTIKIIVNIDLVNFSVILVQLKKSYYAALNTGLRHLCLLLIDLRRRF